MKNRLFDKIYGCLLGGLIGDAIGGPSECLTYQEVEEKFGWIDHFEGCGTDDTVIKLILTDAILKHKGNVTADEWAEAFLEKKMKFYPMYYAPVRNMYHKLEYDFILPVYAGTGNAPSSSSAMSIAPMGIINACNPRRAAAETYDLAGMVHQGEATFCRDGACAVAAAIAEALKPDATVGSIAEASTLYLHKRSSRELIGHIQNALDKVRSGMNYQEFRSWYYENCLYPAISDSRETIPAAMALFLMADGNLEKTAVYAANFGRDSDTIGTIAAAIAGAYQGASAIKEEWVKQIESYYNTSQKISGTNAEYQAVAEICVPDYRILTKQFIEVIQWRIQEEDKIQSMLKRLVES